MISAWTRHSGGPHPPYIGPPCHRCGTRPSPTNPVYEDGKAVVTCMLCAGPEDISAIREALERAWR